MLDINLFRTNPELIKDNIKKKFQDEKLEFVDEIIKLDKELREVKSEADTLRGKRNKISKEIGALMAQGKKDEAENAKSEVGGINKRLDEIKELEDLLPEKIKRLMMVIPNIIADSVPIGRDDSENVELEFIGEARVPDFEVPYHVDILENFSVTSTYLPPFSVFI